MSTTPAVAIFGDEEPCAIYWPEVIAVEHSTFYKGTRIVFGSDKDVVTAEPAADVIEAWLDWRENGA